MNLNSAKWANYFTGIAFAIGAIAVGQNQLTSSSAQAAEIYSPKGVVEVFTSQGCSSCPPADKFVTSINKSHDTLALAWHVDYWDYLGWKDTFAKSVHTDRQRRYSVSFGENQIYTPQAIMNGRSHTVGSRGSSIKATLSQYQNSGKGLPVAIQARLNGDALEIEIEPGQKSKKATLWMVYFSGQKEVAVKRGENRGKNLTYSNIVRDIELIGMVEPDGLKLALPFDEMARKGHDSCALILQKTTAKGTPGPIVGAVVIRDLHNS